MDDTTHYYKDPPKLIYELMQDTLGDRFQYFLGSPISLAQDAYPCVVIQSIASNNTVSGAATGQDNVSERINIHILMLDQTAAASSGTTDTTIRNLYQLVQGRDPETGFYLTGTVMYAMRENIDLYTSIINHDVDINYDVTPQQDKSVIEAILTIVTTEKVSVPMRT